MPTRFEMDGGWKRLEHALDPVEFDKVMKRHLRRATMLNGKLAEREVRQTIKRGGFAPNAALTVAIKGSTKPLVDTGSGLFQAITSKVIDDTTVFIGILRTSDAYNVGLALHEGANIAVTDKMRGLFFVLWEASVGARDPSTLVGRAAELWERMPGGWKRLAESTRAIVIPSRPFIRRAFEQTGWKRKATENWRMAIQAAIKERAGQP